MISRPDLIRELCAQAVLASDVEALNELLPRLQQEIRLQIAEMRKTAAKDIPKWFRVDDSDLLLFTE